MNKYYGKIGFASVSETTPGVWTETIVEKDYYGDITRNSRRWTASSDTINDDLTISNSLSIVSDSYILNNLQNIRYVEWLNQKWKISDIEIAYPRLNLTLGGIYNG